MELTASEKSRRAPARFEKSRRLNLKRAGWWLGLSEGGEFAAAESWYEFPVFVFAFTGFWTAVQSREFDSVPPPSTNPKNDACEP